MTAAGIQDEGGGPGSVSGQRRLVNVLLLGCGWCCAVSALFIQISNTSLAAGTISGGGPSVQTLPAAGFVIAAALSTLPGALLFRAVGRRPVVLAAAALGLVGAGLELLSLYHGGFPLLFLGALIQGPAFSVGNNFRFMAAELSPPAFKPRAISLVVLCGVPAAVVGPEFARQALIALPRAGGFLVLIGVYVLLILAMLCVDWKTLRRLELLGDTAAAAAPPQAAGGAAAALTAPKSCAAAAPAAAPAAAGGTESEGAAGPLPLAVSKDPECASVPQDQAAAVGPVPGAAAGSLSAEWPLMGYRELLLNLGFIVPALICGLSFCGMAAIMAMTPVRMVAVGTGGAAGAGNMSTWVVEAHIVAMYLPGLLSADLIRVAGAPLTAAAGCAMLLGGNAIYYGGDHVGIFFAGMVVIGLGWHFAYVAGSTLIVGVFAKEPRRRLVIQGATDTVVISLSGTAIGTSSALSSRLGWVPFVSIYMGVHGLLAALSLQLVWAWVKARRAAR